MAGSRIGVVRLPVGACEHHRNINHRTVDRQLSRLLRQIPGGVSRGPRPAWRPKNGSSSTSLANWLHHHGDVDDPRAGKIKEALLRAFHPASGEWEALVWSQGKKVTEQALGWVASQP